MNLSHFDSAFPAVESIQLGLVVGERLSGARYSLLESIIDFQLALERRQQATKVVGHDGLAEKTARHRIAQAGMDAPGNHRTALTRSLQYVNPAPPGCTSIQKVQRRLRDRRDGLAQRDQVRFQSRETR